MFDATHQHFKRYLIKKFSTHFRRGGTITMIALQYTELHFHCGIILVKNTEKPTFLILKDDSNLQTVLPESPIS